MICPACKAPNDDFAEACFTCGRGLTAVTRTALIAGRYEVLEPIGRGGMGAVYKAHDRMLDETVALKVLRSDCAASPSLAQRFRQEIKLARRVSHRNVCRIHEYGEEGALRYISMEFVEGQHLSRIAQDHGGCLPPDLTLDLAVQMAEGLQAIHEVGIVHRDLKPTNVMRDSRGIVRLMDFGIAKCEEDRKAEAGLTGTGQIMGTPEYMSPEQCLGEALDHRSDLYSLGIVVYQLLVGVVPFHGDTAVATLFKHMQDPVPLEHVPIPKALFPVLRRVLAKNRADRFSSAAELADAFRRTQHRMATESERPTSPMTTPGASGAHQAAGERRSGTRLDIFVNLVLRRVGTLGTVLQEERTIAENVGRGGARVMTTMSSLSIGDIVHLEEVGGPFKTRAEVRGTFVGRDGIRRLNLRFVDSEAPSYLVHVEGELTTGRAPAPSAPVRGPLPR